MGIRSMNYIALRPGVCLSAAVTKYLGTATKVSDERGTLYVYESNFTPMCARDGRGENCTFDLEEEVAIQRFLGTLPASAFYMTRVGEDCGHRGEWADHPFSDNDQAKSIEAEYQRLVEGPDTLQYLDLSTRYVSEETMFWLNEAKPSESHCSGITIAPYEYGVFVSVPGELTGIAELECAEDLKVVLRYARNNGCDVVRFDSDGMAHSGLPHFDW